MLFKLSDDTQARLKTLALLKKRTAHGLAREAVETFIAQEEEKERRNRQADQAWRHYQETGLHVTGEEILKWVASWGTQNPLQPPECCG
jgi:predicted transcriptional regulator